MGKIQNANQQSRSGWGGKRQGAGAPRGNTNAVKHGERTRRAFFPIPIDDARLTPLVALKVRNLMLAERYGELIRESPAVGTAPWRELVLLGGVMWQHTRRIMATMRKEARCGLVEAKEGRKLTKAQLSSARTKVATEK